MMVSDQPKKEDKALYHLPLTNYEVLVLHTDITDRHIMGQPVNVAHANFFTTWGYGILKDTHKLGLRGRLPTFIEIFLADSTMQVRVDSSLSDYYDWEQGVPQGGVLSTTVVSKLMIL